MASRCASSYRLFFYLMVLAGAVKLGTYLGALYVAVHHGMPSRWLLHAIPLVIAALGHLSFTGLSREEYHESLVVDEDGNDSLCDRLMIRVGSALMFSLLAIGVALYINALTWWHEQSELVHVDPPAASLSPSAPPSAWFSRAPTPSSTPSPSMDPAVALRRREVADNACNTIGLLQMSSTVAAVLAIWLDYATRAALLRRFTSQDSHMLRF